VTTTEDTGTTGGNETDLLTGNGSTGNSGRVTNVLMVTTTVRMLDGVHRGTTDSRPGVALDAVFVVIVTGLEDGLVETTATSDDTNHSAARGANGLAGTRGKTDTGLLAIFGVTDDNARGTGSLGHVTAVTSLGLERADDGTLGHAADGEDVADGQLSLGTEVQELTSGNAFRGNDELLSQLVAIRITEDQAGEGSATTGVMDDLFDLAADVTVALGIIGSAELGGALAMLGFGFKDGAFTFSLATDNASHGVELYLVGTLLSGLSKIPT